MVVMLFIVVLLSPSVSPFLMRVSSLGQQYRILMDFYHGGWDGYPGYKTISQLLSEEGYLVEKSNRPLNEVDLSTYDALLLTYPWNDFSQVELEAIREYVYNGGGLLEVVDTQMYHGRKAPNQVAGLFGVHFYGDMTMSASIVDFNHPITRDKKQEDLFNPFLLYDAAIDRYPSNATVLVRAGVTQTSMPNGTSVLTTESQPVIEDPVAMIALNYGMGRAAFGPLNGLAQPWGTPWYGRNEPNKMLLNTVEWLCGYTLKDQLIEELKTLNKEVHLTVENHIRTLAHIITKVYIETSPTEWDFIKDTLKVAIDFIVSRGMTKLPTYAEFLSKHKYLEYLQYFLSIGEAQALSNIFIDIFSILSDPNRSTSDKENAIYEGLMNNVRLSTELGNITIASYLTHMDEELQTLILNLRDQTIPDDVCIEMINETARIKEWIMKIRSEELSIIYVDPSKEDIIQVRVAGALSKYPKCVEELINYYNTYGTINDLSIVLIVGGAAIKVAGAFIPPLAAFLESKGIEAELLGYAVYFAGESLDIFSDIAQDLTKWEALTVAFLRALPTALNGIKSVGTVYLATIMRMEEWVSGEEYSARDIDVGIKPSYVAPPIYQIPETTPVYVDIPFKVNISGCITVTSNRDTRAAVYIEVFEKGGNELKGFNGYRFSVTQDLKEVFCFSLPFMDSFEYKNQKEYSAVVYIAVGARLYGPFTRIFTVVRGSASSIQGISTSSFSGEVGEGESVSYQIDAPLGTSELIVTLNYAGSDLDLHLYDSQGRHVGMNYETNDVELQMPGAIYNGPNVSREWIIISNVTSPQSFTAEIVGVRVNGRESFSLSYLIITRSIEITPVTSVVCLGRSASYEVSITNFGEREETYILGLEGLDQEWYSFNPQTISVKPGETAKVKLEVNILDEASLGSYAFTIKASNIIGKVIANLEVASSEDVKTNVLSLLMSLKDSINALPPEAFSKEQKVMEMKKALSNKIDAVIKMVEEYAYNGAINKLMNDILVKMDGDPKPKDWIINPIIQTSLKNYINWIITNIKALL
ncbi:MAG: hypothetical protein QW304_07005 [Thermoproteota archaeon]